MKRNYICPEFREIRIESKDHWSKTFRTTNPYDINKRTRNNGNDNNSFIGEHFPLFLDQWNDQIDLLATQ